MCVCVFVRVRVCACACLCLCAWFTHDYGSRTYDDLGCTRLSLFFFMNPCNTTGNVLGTVSQPGISQGETKACTMSRVIRMCFNHITFLCITSKSTFFFLLFPDLGGKQEA